MKVKMRKTLTAAAVLLLAVSAGGQTMTLKDCMQYAITNSIDVRTRQSETGDARIDRRDAILQAFTPTTASPQARESILSPFRRPLAGRVLTAATK